VGFGCDGPPVIGNNALKQRWEEIGEGAESARRICDQVGLGTCADQDFILTYQALRLSGMARLFNSLDGCVAFAKTMSVFAHKGAQLIMLANGIPVPDEAMKLSQAQFNQHTISSCQVLYGGTFNSSDITRVQTTQGDLFVPNSQVSEVGIISMRQSLPPAVLDPSFQHANHPEWLETQIVSPLCTVFASLSTLLKIRSPEFLKN
jgi:hypothetical protein